MAALTALAVPRTGVVAAPAAVAASDTIAEAQFGTNGCYLRVINAGVGHDNVTVLDPGTTALGNAGTVVAVDVANGTTQTILISRQAINPSTGVATVNHSQPAGVTYELYRV